MHTDFKVRLRCCKSDTLKSERPGKLLQQLDYQEYAELEAYLSRSHVVGAIEFHAAVADQKLCSHLTKVVTGDPRQQNAKVAQPKLLALGPTCNLKVGLTQVDEKPPIDGPITTPTPSLERALDIQTTLFPGGLATSLLETLDKTAEASGHAELDVSVSNTRRAGAPHPMHRQLMSLTRKNRGRNCRALSILIQEVL